MKTKIILLISFLLFITSSLVSAQSGNKIGIRAGYQSSGLYDNGELGDGVSNYNSFYVGAFKELKLIPMLFLGAGLEYAPVGIVDASSDSKYILHYLSIPIDIKVNIGPVFALGGLAANFKVAENLTLLDEKIPTSDYEKLGLQKANVFDLPVFIGLGINIMMFNIEARYYYGLTDVLGEDGNTNTSYLQVGAGIRF